MNSPAGTAQLLIFCRGIINFIGIDSKTAGIFVFQAWQISFKQKRRADLCCTAIILTIQNTVVFYYLIYYYNFLY